ncbi:MAG: 16S rRNA (uracil(1498)-N(3))-methyltransferase [Desulfovibrio sp.]|jgi:16S rRNA (uracil1498-N3)-methyltransferase|nr:16S rRNA (uracil(1498)-N(3))-methyltransferase [Desulfovibrio sp.]
MGEPFFYLPPESWSSEIFLDKQEAKHLSRSLRLAPGQTVRLLDGAGRAGRFVILEIQKKTIRLERIEEQILQKPEARAVLAPAFSKAVRRGFFFEKAVELGCDAVWIWQGDHSQGKLPAALHATVRGQMIAGAKQCGNPWLPEVRVFPSGIIEVVAAADSVDYRILPWELQENVPMLALAQVGRPGVSLYVIGPEGGFSVRELALLSGFTPVSLGARVLRCETAATLCLGIHWWASHAAKNDVKTLERQL